MHDQNVENPGARDVQVQEGRVYNPRGGYDGRVYQRQEPDQRTDDYGRAGAQNYPRDNYPNDNYDRRDNNPRDSYSRDNYPRENYPNNSAANNNYPAGQENSRSPYQQGNNSNQNPNGSYPASTGVGVTIPAVARLLARADQSIQNEDYSQAASSAEKAIRIDPQSVAAYHKLAEVYLFERNFPQAEQMAKKALSLVQRQRQAYPQIYQLDALLAQSQRAQGKTPKQPSR